MVCFQEDFPDCIQNIERDNSSTVGGVRGGCTGRRGLYANVDLCLCRKLVTDDQLSHSLHSVRSLC